MMSASGNLMGWLMTAGFFLTLMNYPVKLVYRKMISKMARESKVRRVYVRIQRFVVSNHRYFAIVTALLLFTHIILQLLYRWFSWTGLAAALLMMANLLIGGYGHYVKKKRPSAWLVLHRAGALLLIAAVLAHIVTGGR